MATRLAWQNMLESVQFKVVRVDQSVKIVLTGGC